MTLEETKFRFDLLCAEVKAYRKGKHFKNLLEFCAKFKTLAPYNAMLVRMQMPGARFVLTASQWKKYHRKVRSNAKPLVILIPFGPVDFVFEIQDTYTPKKDSCKYPIEEILEDVEKPYRVFGNTDPRVLDRLITSIEYHGIAYDSQMNAGSNLGAEIRVLNEEKVDNLHIYINNNAFVIWQANYLISTNSKADNGQKIASIVHELGHFFCRHLPAPKDWTVKKGNKIEAAWKVRNLCTEAKEFEAEAVAKIVCDRLGIDTRSERYLSQYLDKDGEIPQEVSIENICLAANKILIMCLGIQKFTYRDGLLSKYDKNFKKIVRDLTSKA